MVLTLVRANEDLHLLGGGFAGKPAVVGVLALLAGYGERFIVGALGTLEQASGKGP